MKKIKWKNYLLNILLVISLSLFVLWLSFKDNYQEIITMLRNINGGYLLLCVVIVLLIQVFIGLGLTLLTSLSNPHYRLKDGVLNALVASFFHGVTPSSSGGQFAQVYVFKKQKVDICDAASVLWMDFIIYQATMVLVVLVLLIVRFAYFERYFSNLLLLVLLGFFINSIIIVGLWALGRFPKVYTFITTKGIDIGCKLKLIKNKEKIVATIDAQLMRFDAETKKLSNHRKLILEVIACNVARLLLYYSIPFFCFLALDIHVSFTVLIDVIAMTAYISMINAFIPIPGSSGGTEAMFVLMFSKVFGLVNASSTMLLWRILSYYLVMLIGGLAFIYVKIKDEVVRRKEGF
ncbi:MAG: flippase-like domain-containing protein [Erysipelotrichaceae bacterium]|nr:flippase-like domain-containing protein [Erysipelotrichaceae bacterium]MDY5252228.1 lysylphosphatidylglycerol synthase transmembrane domain-containing protein [Erysipelotrichaceae bacterium]